ncbi:hypothetical protein Bca52824_096337 [Brassica carinata]|uniref:Sorting nexin C-terminal domain-containing protein n=1 Tax=Brassica carinata TaxID=52824 RepID=A0A8X7P1S4_BRACI|nr:hypothetical protein Bca52824_096337 [Brassica carinata]
MADAESSINDMDSLLPPVDRVERGTWRDLREGSYTEELKRIIFFAAPMAAVVIAQFTLQIISMVMVGHLGNLARQRLLSFFLLQRYWLQLHRGKLLGCQTDTSTCHSEQWKKYCLTVTPIDIPRLVFHLHLRFERDIWYDLSDTMADGIFMTKHPKGSNNPVLDEEQQQEAERRAKFVHELMIEKAPATIVSLVGQNEYKQCAEDLYFFLQSSVCLKQLAFDLLELLLLSAFPEMEKAFKQLRDEKHIFGQYTPN